MRKLIDVVTAELDEFGMGATGCAKIQNGGLYARHEVNTDWRYLCAVDDDADGWRAIDDWFAARDELAGGEIEQ